MADKARWFVVHTYSGYENKVKANLEKTVENRGFQDLILDIQVPMEDVVEEKNDKKRTVSRKKFPGYVIIKMIMTDDTWYIVRNTRGVTGFVGPGSKPVPLTDDEIDSMGIVEPLVSIEVEVGENVRIVSGPLENFVAQIQEINVDKRKLKALVNMFGRETPVELEFNQIEKI